MKIKTEWLDSGLNSHLRELVNNELICHFDPIFKKAHNALCIMMDRVDDSAFWLNQHSDFPQDASDFLLFLVHGDIIVKTIEKVIGKLNINNPYGSSGSNAARQFFSGCYERLPFHIAPDNTPDDNLTWSYLRALAFAHTEETAAKRYYNSFLQEKEKQYSPFPVIDKQTNKVGVVVYSNLWDSSKSFMLPYEALKDFVFSRFNLIQDIVNLAERRIEERKSAYRLETIDESGGPVGTLKCMREKYMERFGEIYAYDFDFALMCMASEITKPENQKNVLKFRRALTKVVPNAANAFRQLDYNSCLKAIDKVCGHSLPGAPVGVNYKLEKVLTHLKKNDPERHFAKQCAKDLAEGFAAKYVKIDVTTMSDEEILLLITVACYLYRKDNPIRKTSSTPVNITDLFRPIRIRVNRKPTNAIKGTGKPT